MGELLAFREQDAEDREVLQSFTDRLKSVSYRHKDLVMTMAGAALEVKRLFLKGTKEEKSLKLPRFERNIQVIMQEQKCTRDSLQFRTIFAPRISISLEFGTIAGKVAKLEIISREEKEKDNFHSFSLGMNQRTTPTQFQRHPGSSLFHHLACETMPNVEM